MTFFLLFLKLLSSAGVPLRFDIMVPTALVWPNRQSAANNAQLV
jgi:hypothetical protein